MFGSTIKEFPSPFARDAWYGSALMPAHQVGAIFVALCVVAFLFAFFRFTSLGLSMRAAAQNPGSSRLLGIGVGRMLMLGWGLAGAIGAIAGMMVAPVVFLDPGMMIGVLMYAFAGALIGGIDNPVGAVLGGFLVGILENLVGTYVVGTELKLSVALVLIVGVLVVRPSGLLGRAIVKRV
jgi:branched-chain amino acid transport system permease protein